MQQVIKKYYDRNDYQNKNFVTEIVTLAVLLFDVAPTLHMLAFFFAYACF